MNEMQTNMWYAVPMQRGQGPSMSSGGAIAGRSVGSGKR